MSEYCAGVLVSIVSGPRAAVCADSRLPPDVQSRILVHVYGEWIRQSDRCPARVDPHSPQPVRLRRHDCHHDSQPLVLRRPDSSPSPFSLWRHSPLVGGHDAARGASDRSQAKPLALEPAGNEIVHSAIHCTHPSNTACPLRVRHAPRVRSRARSLGARSIHQTEITVCSCYA